MKVIIFLYIIIFGYNEPPKREYRVQMPDLKTCYESIKTHESKISNGDESESGIVMFCGTDKIQRCYGTQSSSLACTKTVMVD